MSEKSPATELLTKINKAVAAANEAQTEHYSRSKAVGMLLLEAKNLHPAVKDFDAFLKRVNGLGIARAYELMRVAGGRITDEELKKDARDRQQKSRDKKKIPPKSKKEPDPGLCDVTETAEAERRKAKEAPAWMADARQSSRCLAEFTVACRTYLPRITVEADREEARRLVAELLPAPKAEAA